jgi:hypothetical protein
MIYVDINKIRKEFRVALYATNQNLNDWNLMDSLANFERANNCKVVGGTDAGGYHCTDGLEFPDEQALMFFKLKWS